MKYVKLFSALAVIMAIVISPTTGVFAQTDVSANVNADVSVATENTDKQIYKEKQQIREQIKEQRQDLKSKLTDLQNLRARPRHQTGQAPKPAGIRSFFARGEKIDD